MWLRQRLQGWLLPLTEAGDGLSSQVRPNDLKLTPEGVCIGDFLSKKLGFLLSASCTVTHFVGFLPLFRFSCSLGFLPLQLNQIWRIFCVMYAIAKTRKLVFLKKDCAQGRGESRKLMKNQREIQSSRKPSVLVGFRRQKRTVHTQQGIIHKKAPMFEERNSSEKSPFSSQTFVVHMLQKHLYKNSNFEGQDLFRWQST